MAQVGRSIIFADPGTYKNTMPLTPEEKDKGIAGIKHIFGQLQLHNDNERIKKECDRQLDVNNRKLEANNLQLDANNRKLDANNLKLGANNRKLDGNNLKLDGNNLKLGANNLKLDANNLKLDANNLKLDANNLKLDANNLKLDANNLKLEVLNSEPKKVENLDKKIEINKLEKQQLNNTLQLLDADKRFKGFCVIVGIPLTISGPQKEAISKLADHSIAVQHEGNTTVVKIISMALIVKFYKEHSKFIKCNLRPFGGNIGDFKTLANYLSESTCGVNSVDIKKIAPKDVKDALEQVTQKRKNFVVKYFD